MLDIMDLKIIFLDNRVSQFEDSLVKFLSITKDLMESSKTSMSYLQEDHNKKQSKLEEKRYKARKKLKEICKLKKVMTKLL